MDRTASSARVSRLSISCDYVYIDEESDYSEENTSDNEWKLSLVHHFSNYSHNKDVRELSSLIFLVIRTRVLMTMFKHFSLCLNKKKR